MNNNEHDNYIITIIMRIEDNSGYVICEVKLFRRLFSGAPDFVDGIIPECELTFSPGNCLQLTSCTGWHFQRCTVCMKLQHL